MGTFYFLCMGQRLFTQFVLGILALELLFEFRIGFTLEDRQFLGDLHVQILYSSVCL